MVDPDPDHEEGPVDPLRSLDGAPCGLVTGSQIGHGPKRLTGDMDRDGPDACLGRPGPVRQQDAAR